MTQVPIRLSYFVCGTPRSGSTLLCDTLSATGVAGVPLEYFNDWIFTNLLRAWGVSSVPHYDAFIEMARTVATTPNGVCGVKFHWPYLEKLAKVTGCTLPDLQPIEEIFPNPVFIYLTRLDKLAMALSYLRARQTDVWISRPGVPGRSQGVAAFDYSRIETIRRTLAEHEANWEALFHYHGIGPLRLCYEDLCDDYEGTVRSVLRFIGVDEAGDVEIPPPRIVKHGDETSPWIQRVLVERRLRTA